MYTIEKDFSQMAYGTKVIEEVGRDFDINYSIILTKLIQECGRLCERFASDLFIDWHNIEEEIKNKTIGASTYLFGIREDGVDHDEFILSSYNTNGCNAKYRYRKIYRLDVVVDDEIIIMRLYEIERPYNERGD